MIKALANFELDVLGIPFGSSSNKDAHDEYFSAQTEFHFDKFGLPPAVYYHGFNEIGPMGKPEYIGRCVSREVKGDGVWFRVVLDLASALARKVFEAAQAGVARASSGTIAHLMRKSGDGHITEWPIVELSVFDTYNGKSPANPYAVALPVAKSIYKAAGLQWPVKEKVMPEGQENIDAIVAKAVKSALEQQKEQEEQAKQRQAEIDEAIAKSVSAERAKWELEAAKSRRLPFGSNNAPYVAKYDNTWAYDNLEHGDLAVLIGVLQAGRSIGLSRGASENALKALAIRIASDTDADRQYVHAKMAMKAANLSLKADELNRSNLTDYGQEWVGVTYSTQLWERIRMSTPIVGMIPTLEIPQGSESVIIPLESVPPTFYTVAQASDQDSNPGPITRTVKTSRLKTAKRSISAAKLGASTYYTGELEEDSLIRWVPELRRSIEQEAGEVLEHVVIDGDTVLTSANINGNGVAPTDQPFIIFDGFRKLALVTNADNNRNAGGTLAPSDFLNTAKMLGIAGTHALNKQGVGLILDVNTHWASLQMSDVLTADKVASPTIEDGELRRIFGYSVYPTPNMHRTNQDSANGLKANASGLVSSTAADNTTGSILAVRWDQWRMGWKRRISFETVRVPSADSTEIVCLMRLGLVNRDSEAAAITYNVGV